MEKPTDEWIRGFDGLCALNIYWWADLAWPTTKTCRERQRFLRKAKKAGLVPEDVSVTDGQAIAKAYDEAIEAYGTKAFKPEWKPRHDYYGARCFSTDMSFHSFPNMVTRLTGDDHDRYEFFSSYAVLIKHYPNENA